MKHLIYKELKLAAPLLTYLFLGFTLMTFIPGYPILCGVFFVGMGIFQGYQYSRESGDILYSVILPVKKTDVVKAKYWTAVILQMTAFVLFVTFTVIRMLYLSEAVIYVNNALMGANFTFLAYVLLLFAIFNIIFIGGFFKTAYRIGKPFVQYIIVCFTITAAAEVLRYIPGLEWMNTLGFEHAGVQLILLLCAVIIYIMLTIGSCKISQKRFDRIDL
ncbi:MAG: ABC-2 transporter permease [Ruminococcaceae bacterium]|nr:ABC-2 transporter permease [Oscillospiraceae bacterium]